ncbi:MAG: hypothetical protein ACI82Z_001869 [Cellvibrionaceae bacterium]|jgi:uncharacterized protein (TIGR02444 family)
MNHSTNLWDFACSYYRQPQIESACLHLQDRRGWNVPLILFCCWASSRYGALSIEQIQHAKDIAHAFSACTTEPLRQVRQQMKTTDTKQWAIDSAGWEILRQGIKNLELRSERILLEALEMPYKGQRLRQGSAEAIIHNLTLCFEPFSSDPSIILILEALPPP